MVRVLNAQPANACNLCDLFGGAEKLQRIFLSHFWQPAKVACAHFRFRLLDRASVCACKSLCGYKKGNLLIYLEAAARFLQRIEQLAIRKQNTNRRRCELSFCKLFVLWPCEHIHTNTHTPAAAHTHGWNDTPTFCISVCTLHWAPMMRTKCNSNNFSAFF